MSLLDNFMTECCFVNAIKQSDGEGGFITEYTDGAGFNAAIVLDKSMQARIAEKEGVTSLYTITVSRSVPLDFHDIVKRKKDGATFRITSDGNDAKSPDYGTLDMRQATAERWELA